MRNENCLRLGGAIGSYVAPSGLGGRMNEVGFGFVVRAKLNSMRVVTITAVGPPKPHDIIHEPPYS